MIVGNSRMLAEIKNGTITKIFWPTINNYQNIVNSQIGVYSFEKNVIEWLDKTWSYDVRYVENSNVLETTAIKKGKTVILHDFVLPADDALVRIIEVTEPSKIFCFTEPKLSEHLNNEVLFNGNVIYKSDDVRLGIYSNEPIKECQLGLDSNDFVELNRKCLETKKINEKKNTSAIALYTKGQKKFAAIYFSLAPSDTLLFEQINRVKNMEPDKWVLKTNAYWQRWCSKLKNSNYEDLARRSILVLKLLSDEKHGAAMSSPDYRYCWPRDGVFAAHAFDLCGYYSEAEKFYSWAKNITDTEHGTYLADGTPATKPLKRTDAFAVVLWGLCQHAIITEKILRSDWEYITKGMKKLENEIDKTGLIKKSMNIWEDSFDAHTYTVGVVCAAFDAAAELALVKGERGLSEKWNGYALDLKKKIENLGDKTFPASVSNAGVDASLLGLVAPFGVIEPWNQKMKETANRIEKELWSDGLRRYAADVYNGGNAWPFCTAWLACYYKKAGSVDKFKKIMNVLTGSACNGVFPEQTRDEKPVSSIPHALSHAMFLIALMS